MVIRGDVLVLFLSQNFFEEQFDVEGCASIRVPFAGKLLTVVYKNEFGKDFGSYRISLVVCDKDSFTANENTFIRIPQKTITALSGREHRITVTLV